MATIASGKGTLALAAFDAKSGLKKHEFGRPAPGPQDVAIDIAYCGMCHSDVHATNGQWGINKYPMAPGHEIAGIVKSVGSEVKDIKIGDRVGVGCMVNNCGTCDLCKKGLDQHCPQMIQTYSSEWPADKGHDECKGTHTNGGYSSNITVHSKFVFPIPAEIELQYAGPLLCAGVTTYSPLARHVKDKKDQDVGVVGFGGLGHVAVKIATAMGAKVTVFSRNLDKTNEAKALGAGMVSHKDAEELKKLVRAFDCIIDTVSEPHDVAAIMSTLKVGGTYCILGGVPEPYSIPGFPMLFNRWSLEGSLIAGVPETIECLAFCAKHKILPDIDVIHAKDASDAFVKMQTGAAGAKRNVIDMSTLASL